MAAEGRYMDALKLIKKENPFPAVCGHICNRRCEQACTRGSVDRAVAIGCGVCTTRCEFDAIHLRRDHQEATKMIRSEDKMKAILPYMVKRAARIKVKELRSKRS